MTDNLDEITNDKCFYETIPNNIVTKLFTTNKCNLGYIKIFLNNCNYVTLTPNMTFILVYLSIKKSNPNYFELISLLEKRYDEWINLQATPKLIVSWIKQLKNYKNKSFAECSVDLSLYVLFESYHKECFTKMISKLDQSKINFVRGMHSTFTPYTALNNNNTEIYTFTKSDIIDSITMKSGSNHSQLYIINRQYKYICDSDIFSKPELEVRKLGKLSNFQIMKIFPIQSITDDSYCIFYSLKLLTIICENKFINFDKSEVKQINKVLTSNGNIKMASKFLINWIHSLF